MLLSLHLNATLNNVNPLVSTNVILKKYIQFWLVHGIMNNSGLLQSKWSVKVFTLSLQETRCVHDSVNRPKLNLFLIVTFYHAYLTCLIYL